MSSRVRRFCALACLISQPFIKNVWENLINFLIDEKKRISPLLFQSVSRIDVFHAFDAFKYLDLRLGFFACVHGT